MNAPYDGERGPGTGGDPAGQAPAPPPSQGDPSAQNQYDQNQYDQGPYAQGPHGQQPQAPYNPYARDPYVQEAYQEDPYWAQERSSQDPVSEALHDRAARPPQTPGPYQDATQQLYPQQPQQSQQHGQQPYGPDPRVWAQPPAPGTYGDDTGTTQLTGVDDLVSRAGTQPQQDAFAHLYRDQRAGAPAVPEEPEPEIQAPAPTTKPAKSGGLLKSSAVMAAGTLVSRLTGFVRSLVITAAFGATLLGDSWSVAYTLPTMIYILTVGGGLNSVFVPQLVRAMKEDDDNGEAYANRLLTLAMVALAIIVAIVVLGAPELIHALSSTVADSHDANNVGVTFARYCLPTIFFMGIHVIMGQILNARGKFGAMMWTPVLNNIIMIVTFGLFIYVYGTAADSHMTVHSIPPDGVRLLGIGTLLGLTVQALAMIPYLREAGFRFRLRFDWRGHGLGKTVALAKWTVLFVLANQAGVVVVTQLSTAAGKASGVDGTGFLAYSNAQLIWGMPQAIITVSVMAALLPRISRAASDGDSGAVRDDISQGLRTSAVAIVPIAFMFLALGVPISTLLFSSSGLDSARSMGYILMAFGLGLIPYSVQYVVLRGFYAYEDTRTPFYNTVIVAAVNAAASAICYVVLPARWAVVGMAASYGLAYAVGVGVAWRRLAKRVNGDLDGKRVLRTYARLCMAAIPAAVIGGALGFGILNVVSKGAGGAVLALIVGGAALIGIFYVAAKKMRIEELNGMVGMVRGRLGR
ncbi:murein biosynthesis integral membrane protein MurJ [Streptomyces sp. 8L]|uniref:murein biosynthesis integral membrane protein MurJ n=1 Tax=Streptomyces sp. 8L TaxID=2877242 RepID=UPI001CD6F8D1|nr:murein biosynthesis integral membrane protein MurJ [Streptomyces sp. 8L]MCA1218910.1 murein biosynthesis integral membrane protein MurJ [Streptomyces sp. 8L]